MTEISAKSLDDGRHAEHERLGGQGLKRRKNPQIEAGRHHVAGKPFARQPLGRPDHPVGTL